MNINGFSIRPISEPIDGDTRYRNIKGYAITDGGDHVVAEFATLQLASAAWDMIVSESEEDDEHHVIILTTVDRARADLADGDAREA